MKAILLGNGSREGVLESAVALRPEIERIVDVALADFDNEADLSNVSADVAIVFGGDGSILRAVHQMGENQIPVLAVNLGTLGFLSSVDPEGLVPFLRSSDFDNFVVREQLLLNCSIWRKDRRKKRREDDSPSSRLRSFAYPSDWRGDADDRRCVGNYLVVNEVTARGGPPFSILHIDLSIDGELVAAIRGDGLIIATPVGSTAHSLSAGGPILRNELDAVVITPLSPHALTFRSVVDSAARVYELSAVSDDAFVVVDGFPPKQLLSGDRVVLRRAPFSFKMARVPENRYYHNLRGKLGWGVDSAASRRAMPGVTGIPRNSRSRTVLSASSLWRTVRRSS